MSVEQTALSVTFGQPIIGQATYNVESANWIEQSDEAKIQGQVVDARNAMQFAKTLWLIYVLLTVACALALWFAGLTSFSTNTEPEMLKKSNAQP